MEWNNYRSSMHDHDSIAVLVCHITRLPDSEAHDYRSSVSYYCRWKPSIFHERLVKLQLQGVRRWSLLIAIFILPVACRGHQGFQSISRICWLPPKPATPVALLWHPAACAAVLFHYQHVVDPATCTSARTFPRPLPVASGGTHGSFGRQQWRHFLSRLIAALQPIGQLLHRDFYRPLLSTFMTNAHPAALRTHVSLVG